MTKSVVYLGSNGCAKNRYIAKYCVFGTHPFHLSGSVNKLVYPAHEIGQPYFRIGCPPPRLWSAVAAYLRRSL